MSGIIVTGPQRAGLGIVAKILHMAGVKGGRVTAKSRWTAGTYENEAVMKGIIRPRLRGMGADPYGQCPLPPTPLEKHGRTNVETVRDHLREVLESQSVDSSHTWYVKCSQIALMWPQFALGDVKWVLVQRPVEELVQSCMATGYMRGYDDRDGWRRWCKHYEDCLLQIRNSGVEYMDLWPHKFLREGDVSELKKVLEWVGYRLSPSIVSMLQREETQWRQERQQQK